jgi:hypothetical protein
MSITRGGSLIALEGRPVSSSFILCYRNDRLSWRGSYTEGGSISRGNQQDARKYFPSSG